MMMTVLWTTCRLAGHAVRVSAANHLAALARTRVVVNTDDATASNKPPTLHPHTIVHVTHRGGGTERAVRDLVFLFPQHNHVVVDCRNASSVVATVAATSQRTTLHLHSCVVNGTSWDVTGVLTAGLQAGARVLLTVHDYQWVSPLKPNPVQDELVRRVLAPSAVRTATTLMTACHAVIFPTRSVYDNYERVLGRQTMMRVPSVIAPHPDYPVHYETEAWPPLVNGMCTIAFVGDFLEVKGARTFVSVVRDAGKLAKLGPCTRLQFNVFGYVDLANDFGLTDALGDDASLFWAARSSQAAGANLAQRLHDNRVHVLLLLSTVPETYSYTLTHCVNSGLPVVHTGQGALYERLHGRGRRFFHAASQKDVPAALTAALSFVARTRSADKAWQHDYEGVRMSGWYRDVYGAA